MSSPFANHAGSVPAGTSQTGASAALSLASPFLSSGGTQPGQAAQQAVPVRSVYGGTPSATDPLGSLPSGLNFTSSFSSELNQMLLSGKIPSLTGSFPSQLANTLSMSSPASSVQPSDAAAGSSSGAPTYASVASVQMSTPMYTVTAPASLQQGYILMQQPSSAMPPPPPLHNMDPDQSKRSRSSGLTNMMVVPDGKAQRTKSGQQQQGPTMAAMGRTGVAYAGHGGGAMAAPPQPHEIPKEVKSHTARSLLRMLRAGTGVKTSNNIPIVEAETVVKKLAGEFAPVDILKAKKRNAGREALSVLLSLYIQKPVTMYEAAQCFHNPTNRGLEPTTVLWNLIGNRTWPPCPEDGKAARRPKELATDRLKGVPHGHMGGGHAMLMLHQHPGGLPSPFAMPAPGSAPVALASPFAVPESSVQAPLLPHSQLVPRGLVAPTTMLLAPHTAPSTMPVPVHSMGLPSTQAYALAAAAASPQLYAQHAPPASSALLMAGTYATAAFPSQAPSSHSSQPTSHSASSQDSGGPSLSRPLYSTALMTSGGPHAAASSPTATVPNHSSAYGSPALGNQSTQRSGALEPRHSTTSQQVSAVQQQPPGSEQSPPTAAAASSQATAEEDLSADSEGPFSSMAGPIKSGGDTDEQRDLDAQRRDDSLSGMLASASMDLGSSGGPHRHSTLSGPTFSTMFGNIDSSWPSRHDTLSGILGSDSVPTSAAMGGPSFSGILAFSDPGPLAEARKDGAEPEQAQVA